MVPSELQQKDRLLLATIGLLSYFALSGVLAPMGLLIEPISAQLDLSDVEAARLLSGFSSGNLVGAVLALFILSWFSYKRIVMTIYTSAAGILVALGIVNEPALIWFLLAGLGLTLGIGLAVAAQLIAVIYKADQRAALLVATDSSFSLAGTVMAGLTMILLATPILGVQTWAGVYLPILIVVLLILGVASFTRYPSPEIVNRSWRWLGLLPWPVWSVGAALFAYTLGQTTVLLWLPSALVSEAPDLSLGGEAVSRYWMGMFIGQLTAVVLVIGIGRRKVLWFGAFGAAAGASALLLMLDQASLLPWVSLLWGILNFGALKMLIALATDAVKRLPDAMIPGLLLLATAGTATSPLLSSWVVEMAGARVAMGVGVASLVVMALLALVTSGFVKQSE